MWPAIVLALTQALVPRALDAILKKLDKRTTPQPAPRAGRPEPHILFAISVLTVCQRHQCSITSWFRTPARNNLVDGHPASRHLTADAFDIVPDVQSESPKIVRAIQALGYYALIEPHHIHIQRIPPADRTRVA